MAKTSSTVKLRAKIFSDSTGNVAFALCRSLSLSINISGTGAFVSVEKLTQDDDCNCLPWSFFGDWNARRSGTHYSQLRRE